MDKERTKGEKLENARHEKFANVFVSADEFFGNGVQSYIKAFGIDTSKKGQYEVAKVGAHRLLTDINILDRIDELLEMGGLNDQFVDKQLKLLIAQKAELGVSVRAINEYNKLKKRTERDTADQVVKIVVVSPDSPKPEGDKPF